MTRKFNMKSVTRQEVFDMCSDISDALRNFGEYLYSDKGPSEVMDVDHWEEKIRSLPADEAETILIELAGTGHHGEMLASEILCNLQDWDEIFENEQVAELL